MSTYKKLIPCLGCLQGKPVVWNDTDKVLGEDLVSLCSHYDHNGADGIFLYDGSVTDQEHEETIGLIKDAARACDAPIITGGNIKRLEDVKKYLYAGARGVFLDMSQEHHIDLLKEAADRFGPEKIYAYLPDPELAKRAEEFGQLGASVLILDFPDGVSEDVLEAFPKEQPVWMVCQGSLPVEELAFLRLPAADGVLFSITDETISCIGQKQVLKSNEIPVDTFESSVEWKDFKKNSDGLVPVIVQDYQTQEVLMLAYMNEESFQATLTSGRMTYYSRSRQCLWLKGETSGHYQYVKSLDLDCDNDTILAKVAQIGAACHTGSRSCFFQNLVKKEYRETNPLKVFEDVFQVILDRKEHPKEGSYTNYLFDKGIDKILKKVGEEATEIVIAAKNPNPEEIKYEISDFLYHMMV
ncbi:MAG: bifunctional phosphoribosyl-AMP cyclohydrolase/phosphoribosyl-ATP diphosphatase HisIE, partial [Lachnospiraceae bacterium]